MCRTICPHHVSMRGVLAAALVAFVGGLISSDGSAANLPEPVADATAIPYRDVGYVGGGGAFGTAFVAHHRAIVVSAAHVFYAGNSFPIPDGLMWWEFPIGKNNGTPAGPSKQLRAHAVYTGSGGYAALATQHGANSPFTLNQDIVAAYGYEDIVTHAPPSTPEDAIQRLRSNRDKTIVGYAGSFYQDRLRPSTSPDADLLHATEPIGDRFDGVAEVVPNLFHVIGSINNTKLILAAGGSGSPLYVKDNDNQWLPAGICVAAPPELLLTPDNSLPDYAGTATVRAFRAEDVTALITPLLPQFTAPPVFETDLPATGTALYGDSTVLNVLATGWGTITYQWFKDGQSLPAPPVPTQLVLSNITSATAGTYTVRATNANGTTTSRAHLLTVTSSPVITEHPHSDSFPYGNTGTLTFQFRGEAPFSIQWYRDDVAITGATTATLTFPNGVTFADEGSYRARISNTHGEAWTTSATLLAIMGPGYIGNLSIPGTAPGPTTRVTIAPSAAYERETQFQWRFNGADIAGATDRVLDLGRVGPGDFGTYSLAVTHPRGSTTSATSVTINAPATPSFPESTMIRQVAIGDRIRLGRQLHAAAVVSYQWQKDGQPIVGATARTLDLAPVSAALVGDYTLQAVTPQGTMTSNPIQVRTTAHEFWTEIPLLTASPARSGGIANGKVLLFGDRWRTTFNAGALPDQINAWFGPTNVTDLCWGNGNYVAIAQIPNGSRAVYSTTDGATWVSQKPRGLAPVAVAFGGGVFVAGPLDQSAAGQPWRKLTSTDGQTWTLAGTTVNGANPPVSWTAATMTFGGGKFIALDATSRVASSADGQTWAFGPVTSAYVATTDLAHNGARFASIANNAAVSYSDDGVTWQEAHVVTSAPALMAELVAGDGWFAARTTTGRLALSRDGIYWELQPDDTFDLARLVGIASGRLYAIRDDGVPLVSRPLGTIALVIASTDSFRLAGQTGTVTAHATGGAGNLTYQWYLGQSGETAAPIAGATSAQLALPAGTGVTEVWVRVNNGTDSRDSATIHNREFQPGFFFSQSATRRTAAWLRANGTLTWIGRRAAANSDLDHLRRGTLFPTGQTELGGWNDHTAGARISMPNHHLRFEDAEGISFIHAANSETSARLDAATRVSGPRPAGYYRGGIPARIAAELEALALPDGRVMIGLHTANAVLTGDAIADSAGNVSFDFGGSGQISLSFNHSNGRFTGMWTHGGGTPNDTLTGVREGSDSGIVLANLSGRTWLPGAGQVAIGGFAVEGSGPQRIVARGIGPALLEFNVPDAARHPTLRLFSGQTELLANTRWSTDPRAAEIASVGGRLGAFTLDPAGDDSATITELNPGAYTFHVFDPSGGGTALAELYFDREFSGNGRLINLSTRGWVDNAGAVVIAGFAITGDGPRQVLLRGIGPALQDFGVTDAAQAVTIELFTGTQSLVPKTGWAQLAVPSSSYGIDGEPYMRNAMAAVSAFSLQFEPESDDEDAALLVWLQPGTYTLVVRNARGSGGTALGEVYDMSFDAPR